MKRWWTPLIVLAASCAPSHATEKPPASIEAFFEQHCYECHDAGQEGDLNLEGRAWTINDADSFEFWKKLYFAVKDERMPPEERPDHHAVERFLDALGKELGKAEKRIERSDGRAVARRLTVQEFENNVKDLLGLPYFDAASYLPEDVAKHSFTKNQDSLDFSSVHLESYMKSNQTLLDSLDAYESKPKATKKAMRFMPFVQTKQKGDYSPGILKENGELLLFTNGYASHKTRRPRFDSRIDVTGYYRITFQAKAIQTEEPQLLALVSLGQSVRQKPWVDLSSFYVAPGEYQSFSKKVWLEADSALTFTHPNAKHRRNATIILDQPGLAISEVKLEGPFYDEWPLKRQQVLWGDLPISTRIVNKRRRYAVRSTASIMAIHKLIHRFAASAYSHKLTTPERQLYVDLFDRSFAESQHLKESLITTYKAILSSPTFVYKIEEEGELSQYDLANRLSYFLWNSKADGELLELAEDGKLTRRTLAQQASRLLDDPRSIRFVSDFTEQWLNLDELFLTDPDSRLYPEGNKPLFLFMKDETTLFLDELIKRDLSVSNVVESDFAMLNEPLAKHYGIDGVRGLELRPVALPERHERGGIITQGSVLKVTANGTVTSPIPRGVWFLETILGTHLPLPPNEVPAFEPEVAEGFSLREGLKRHQSEDACASCHKKIDPPGFAFESFDPIGRYRDQYRVHHRNTFKLDGKVDSSGHMSDGSPFGNIQEFQQLVLRDRKAIAENLVDKLSIYATGTSLSFSDREALDKIIEASVSQDLGVKTIILNFIDSDLFRRK